MATCTCLILLFYGVNNIANRIACYRDMDLFWPQMQMVPLSSELTILDPSGLQANRFDWIRASDWVANASERRPWRQVRQLYLNIQHRMASPFSWDNVFVFDPSFKSHKMIVPSTEPAIRLEKGSKTIALNVCNNSPKRYGKCFSAKVPNCYAIRLTCKPDARTPP